MRKSSKKYVFLAGGLTGGPIFPLLAVIKYWQTQDSSIVPVVFDQHNSVAHNLAKKHHYVFHRMPAAKLPRYKSWNVLLFIPKLILSLIFANYWLAKYRPIAVLGAGGFIQVPLIWSAWFWRVPRFIHQQDVKPTLSNQLCSVMATRITTAFESSQKDFRQDTGLGKKYVHTNKILWTGNPNFHTHKNKKINEQLAHKHFHLRNDLPVLLVVGGGTGAQFINNFIVENLESLTKVVQILHITGQNKLTQTSTSGYHSVEFLDNIELAYTACNLVLSRAGIGTLTDLVEYKKPAIIVPMPDTHQEVTAAYLYHKQAAVILDQRDVNLELFIKVLRKILFNPNQSSQMVQNLTKLLPNKADSKIYHFIIEAMTNESKR